MRVRMRRMKERHMTGRARSKRVAIVGAGSIGAGWARVFARAGFSVTLNDVDETQLGRAEAIIAERLAELGAYSLLPDTPAAVAGRIRYEADLAQAVAEADLVVEAAPEVLDLKRALFEKL